METKELYAMCINSDCSLLGLESSLQIKGEVVEAVKLFCPFCGRPVQISGLDDEEN
jgi:hypothetical protein